MNCGENKYPRHDPILAVRSIRNARVAYILDSSVSSPPPACARRALSVLLAAASVITSATTTAAIHTCERPS
jgi:hypothetical protein